MVSKDYILSYIYGRKYQLLKHFITGYKLKPYNGKAIFKGELANKCLNEAIVSGKPFMAGRFGTTECLFFVNHLEIELNIRKKYRKERMNGMVLNSGFFPNKIDAFYRYGEMMKKIYPCADILAPMGTLGDRYVIQKYCKNAVFVDLGTFDPINLWVKSLKNKKVLVVHPFAQTIKSQYERIDKVWPNGEVPIFKLDTVKAVQSLGGNSSGFETWFDALESMQEEMDRKQYDIALIGCGAYGFPLAIHAKQTGHQAVHVGGALQLFFGILGKRWENQEYIKPYINRYWVRPSETETPTISNKVEGGCYW